MPRGEGSLNRGEGKGMNGWMGQTGHGCFPAASKEGGSKCLCDGLTSDLVSIMVRREEEEEGWWVDV